MLDWGEWVRTLWGYGVNISVTRPLKGYWEENIFADKDKIFYRKTFITEIGYYHGGEGGNSPHYFQLWGGRVAFPQKSKIVHDPVWALFLVALWVNIDNHNINIHYGIWVVPRRWSRIRFDPTATPFTVVGDWINMKCLVHCDPSLCLKIIHWIKIK